MADVRPFPALRYAPNVDLAAVICPPYDVISPQEQLLLHQRSPHNAIHLELPPPNGDPYQRAADTLRGWLQAEVLRRDDSPAFYLYRQQFQHDGRAHHRRILFARLRLEEWERGVVLPHEHTGRAAKEDRLNLLRATRLNTSPVFLLYRDRSRTVGPLLADCELQHPPLGISDTEGRPQALWPIDDPQLAGALSRGFQAETLYVADGHHRYETALAYRDERRAACRAWTGDEPENFVLAALTAAGDPGLLVLPTHRLVNAPVPVDEAFQHLARLFQVEAMPSPAALLTALAERGHLAPAFGLAASGSPDLHLLSLADPDAVAALLPPERSAAWRSLDTAIATYAVLRHALGLDEAQLADSNTLWYTEDAREALAAVREGPARFALLLNAIPVDRILAVADAGERMPPKSTFFYPKVPTGLAFNPLDAAPPS